jgi:16S rRNA (cytidine1402-2'-O)-methyltransferase
MPGTLFVVATPIGNLEDLTFRARRVLAEVGLIAAEDTRRTAKLLAHYAIHTPLVSLHEHNEAREAPRLARRIADGLSVALVSDAGTPGLSDPGADLVRETRHLGAKVVPIPGPSAVTAALSVSGFDASEFVFLGFPPRSGQSRAKWLDGLSQEARVVVFFEAPHRIRRTIGEVRTVAANRPILCFRELSKIHEELVLWPIGPGDDNSRLPELRDQGEFTVVLGPGQPPERHLDEHLVAGFVGYLIKNEGLEREATFSRVAAAIGVDTVDVKKIWKRTRFPQREQE